MALARLLALLARPRLAPLPPLPLRLRLLVLRPRIVPKAALGLRAKCLPALLGPQCVLVRVMLALLVAAFVAVLV